MTQNVKEDPSVRTDDSDKCFRKMAVTYERYITCYTLLGRLAFVNGRSGRLHDLSLT